MSKETDRAPVSIILDTDMDTDCDDAGALAVLHALSDLGAANIIGVVCDTPTPWGPRCIRAINRHYGRLDIPIGMVDTQEHDERYAAYRKHIRDMGPHRLYNRVLGRSEMEPDIAANAVDCYRRWLAAEPDHSVVICAIGLLTVIGQLLESGPDRHSPLTGIELAARKVRKLVTMGGGVEPEGEDAFNWRMDAQAAAFVLDRWPTPVAVSSHGSTIWTGEAIFSQLDEDHPVRKAYEIYLGEGKIRPSWDQVALLYAVYGNRLFHERAGASIQFCDDNARYNWVANGGREDIFVIPSQSIGEITALIEALMTAR